MVTQTGQLRIIAGKWRSRKIRFPALPGVRPTHNRIRETLFNWLDPYIEGSSCLDLFAGSGALGFEALSRGAAAVTLVDSIAEVIEALDKNSLLLQAENCEIIQVKIPESQPRFANAPFDIVFLDPPFHQNLIESTVSWMLAGNYLKSTSRIYIEVENGLEPLPIPDDWHVLKHKQTTSLDYYLILKE